TGGTSRRGGGARVGGGEGEVRNEPPPPQFSAFGRGRCRAAGRDAHCLGANLSDAAGAHHRRLSARWPVRHPRAPDRSAAVRAPRPAIHHRERPGATGNIGTQAVRRAPADGHTLLLAVPSNGIAHVLYDKLNFNFIRDTAPVAGISNGPLVMEVNPTVPAQTVPEFIAHAKANPGKINFASPGNGSTIHLCGELFKMMTGVNMVHVPYRGNAPALTDLLAGQVQMMFADTPSSIEHLRA